MLLRGEEGTLQGRSGARRLTAQAPQVEVTDAQRAVGGEPDAAHGHPPAVAGQAHPLRTEVLGGVRPGLGQDPAWRPGRQAVQDNRAGRWRAAPAGGGPGREARAAATFWPSGAMPKPAISYSAPAGRSRVNRSGAARTSQTRASCAPKTSWRASVMAVRPSDPNPQATMELGCPRNSPTRRLVSTSHTSSSAPRETARVRPSAEKAMHPNGSAAKACTSLPVPASCSVTCSPIWLARYLPSGEIARWWPSNGQEASFPAPDASVTVSGVSHARLHRRALPSRVKANRTTHCSGDFFSRRARILPSPTGPSSPGGSCQTVTV